MKGIGDWYDGQVANACGLTLGCGFICFFIGILKELLELDRRERRFIMWASGLVKMLDSLVIMLSPDSAGHIFCSAGCAIGLVLLIMGAIIDNLAWMCGHGHRRGKEAEAVMGAGAVLSIISGSLKAAIHLIEYVFS